MDLKIETLDLENFDLEEIQNNKYNSDEDENNEDLINFDNENIINFDDINIIYSYPYYSDKTFDYEYRISIDKDNIILDEVKCNDNNCDFDNCIILIKNVFNQSIKDFKENILKKNIKYSQNSEIIDLNFDYENEEEKQKMITKNKEIVLSELYKEVYDCLSN